MCEVHFCLKQRAGHIFCPHFIGTEVIRQLKRGIAFLICILKNHFGKAIGGKPFGGIFSSN